jgi:hypothetical protein
VALNKTGYYPQDGTNPTGPISNVQSNAYPLQGVPSQSRPYISGPGVVQVGSPTQFAATVSLKNGNTLQLVGHVSDATNQNTDPALQPFTWVSNNNYLATISTTGLVTLTGKTGSVSLELRHGRASNSWPAQNPQDFAFSTLELQITN